MAFIRRGNYCVLGKDTRVRVEGSRCCGLCIGRGRRDLDRHATASFKAQAGAVKREVTQSRRSILRQWGRELEKSIELKRTEGIGVQVLHILLATEFISQGNGGIQVFRTARAVFTPGPCILIHTHSLK